MKTKIYKLLSSAKQGLFALALTVFSGTAYSQTTITVIFTGAVQTVTLPAGNWGIQCWGANGGSISTIGGEGIGGYSKGEYYITTSGTLLNVLVGGKGFTATGTSAVAGAGGWNGGGGGAAVGRSGAGGGGATDVRAGGFAAINRIIVAGGGGGAAYYGSTLGTSSLAPGGNGGATLAQNGSIVNNSGIVTAGGGGAGANGITPGSAAVGTASGTATGGGGGGSSAGSSIGQPGTGGGAGGYAGASSSGATGSAGGGGGGYAGGAGGVQTSNGGVAGGGGSGYIGGVTSGTTIMFGQPGFVPKPALTGDGLVIITELCNFTLVSNATNSVSPSICIGQSLTLTTNAISNYSWSTGATTSSLVVAPTTNTVYTLTAMSPSNCMTSRTISVTVSAGIPTISIGTSTNQVCLGQSAILTASGALTYTWTGNITNGVSFTPAVSSGYTVTGQNGCGQATGSTSITVGPLPVTVSSATNQVCANTAISLSVASAGTSYTWQPMGTITTNSILAVTPSVNSTYTVAVSDGTCSGTGTISLITKPNPTLTLVGTSTTICDGQSVNLTVSGADTYTWTTNPPGPAITGTMATVSPTVTTLYQISGTNSFNCTTGASHIVLVNTAPPITTNLSSTVICMGGSVTLSASGAGTYIWSHGPQGNPVVVSPTISTVYAVIGTASTNTCSATRFYTVDVASPVLGVSAATTICQGEAATISAGPGTSFSWSPSGGGFASTSVSPTVTTTFSVTANVLSSGIFCPANNTVVVTVNQLPTVTATAPTTVICRKDPLVITASGATSYSWSTLAQSASITFSSIVANTQTLTVTGTDVNGCKNTGSIAVKINLCNAIGENAGLVNFHVYPVPSKGEVFIKCDQNLNIQVVNSIGQVVRNIELNLSNNHEISVKDLSSGVYFIQSKNGQLLKKLVVE